MIWSVIKQRNEILRYQLIQHEPSRFELKILTADKQTYERVVGGAIADLRTLLGNSIVVEARYAEELSAPTTKKFRPVLSHCKPSQLR